MTSTPQLSDLFHPAVAGWFSETFPAATDVQLQAWPAIAAKQDTLIAAPTGSGKTLSAFLAVIDDLVRRGASGTLEDKTYVVYVSPLKALSNDIDKNLQAPLAGIAERLCDAGEAGAPLTTAVRTGDTTSSARQKMLKAPPHILVTTPESLYLLLTSDGGRTMLRGVETMIVDEIHAVVGDKRGSHLALSLARLAHLTGRPPVRIGLSATQKPVEQVAAFLTGVDAHGQARPCTIIDSGHQRPRDLAIEVPGSPLSAVMEAEVWAEVYDRMVALIAAHDTTLIFVNTRRLAERLAHQLAERVGEDQVCSHHGSMSKEKRFAAEQRLKNGNLKVLVATASLELGIDIGSVDLVIQLGSPKSIAGLLQRVGRAGHQVGGISKGRLFPLTRDDLVECAALLDAVRRGELDAIVMPEAPIDILAQQIVAEVAAGPWHEDELYKLVRRAWPYRTLARETFDCVLHMLVEGFTLRRGRRGAYLHYDSVARDVRPRRGARLTALTCGGAIPDTFEFDVVLEPAGIKVGTLDEDFALESMPGDIFQLGNNSWLILKVNGGKVRVADAQGQPPTIPFWLGEGPGRTHELSQAVARLRHEVVERTAFGASTDGDAEIDGIRALAWLQNEVGVHAVAAQQLVEYLGTSRLALGAIPTQTTIVCERFFDEAGDMHVVVHAPFGSRMNRAWGLALRKRFCKSFNFELQAAATEDAIILSLGSTHSFPLDDVWQFLSSKTVRDVLIQALLDAPMFEVRWRWNASRALAILRSRAGKRTPPQLQRMDAEDLVALVFPDQLACLENITGAREVPDHPLVQQTIQDCLTEAMDIDALEALLRSKEANELTLLAKDLREPSPLAQEIINAKPYAFLDDTPLEERRTNAIKNRRWLDPAEAAQLATLDADAIARVREQAWPRDVRDIDEMHDALVLSGFLSTDEVATQGESDWPGHLETLADAGRATICTVAGRSWWTAVERLPEHLALFAERGGLTQMPSLTLPLRLAGRMPNPDDALRELIRSRLEALGPVTADALAMPLGLEESEINIALAALEHEGFVFQGQFTPGMSQLEWCERRLLARIHKYTVGKLRAEIQPVSVADFMRFLFEWQHLDADTHMRGPEGVMAIATQLQGYELPAAAWESDIVPGRVLQYDPAWLDQACLSGRLVWSRLTVPDRELPAAGPIRSSPLALYLRENAASLFALMSDQPQASLSASGELVYGALQQRGALFFDDLVQATHMLPTQLEATLAELAASGLVTADSFMGIRALLTPQELRPAGSSPRHRRRKRAPQGVAHAGRWSILDRRVSPEDDRNDAVEAFAWILLQRYGAVFRKLLARERLAPPWRELVRVLRLLEARGEVRGGYFVEGVSGEQFALPDVVQALRSTRRKPADGRLTAISAADPLNLVGILTSDARVPALAGNRILFRDGVPLAVLEAGEIRLLDQKHSLSDWEIKRALERRTVPPKLRPYLRQR